MRIYGRLAILGMAALTTGTYWLWPSTNQVRAQAIAPQASADRVNPLEMPFKWEGVASCSANACHGGSNPRGTLNGEYTYVMKGIERLGKQRGHAYAHVVLQNEVSQRMGKFLGIEKPHQAAVCLNCHASNPDKKYVSASGRFSIGDGVGCESCHGPSEKWIEIHDQRQWASMSNQKKTDLGFINTKDLLVRAKVCMGCHVGSALEQDVYHDLIAAGHPRLNFEFSSYHSNMERHWRSDNDRKMHPDLGTRGWVVGQIASAQAALQLLGHRAGQNKVWPEFAEYDCFACHHDLSDPSWRQKRGYASRKPGSLPWGSWYVGMPMEIVKLLEGETAAKAGQELNQLNEIMQSPYPPTQEVTKLASQAAATLEKLSVEINASSWTKEKGKALLAGLVARGVDISGQSWDRATQTCLGIAALQEGQFELGGGDESVDPLIDSLFNAVNMPRGFNSPKNFQPDLIRSEVEKIQQKFSK